MNLVLNQRLIRERVSEMRITRNEVRQMTGLDLYTKGALLEPSLGQLNRLAALLEMLPLDLIDQRETERASAAHDEHLLLMFAVARAPLRLPAVARFLGWSSALLREVLAETQARPGQDHPCHIDKTGGWWRVTVTAEGTGPAESGPWLAERTAPDPFDAATVLHLAETPTGTGAAPIDPGDLRRLTERHLADPRGQARTRDGDEACVSGGPVRLHPDLLFALDLAGPPPPSGAAAPAVRAETTGGCDPL